MDKRIEELASPVNTSLRKTILEMVKPPYVKDGGWQVNSEREDIKRRQAVAEQEQEVVDKRFKIQELADMIKAFQEETEIKVSEIREYAKLNELDSMLDFCPWETYTIDSILESDPVSAALKWMHSDHSC